MESDLQRAWCGFAVLMTATGTVAALLPGLVLAGPAHDAAALITVGVVVALLAIPPFLVSSMFAGSRGAGQRVKESSASGSVPLRQGQRAVWVTRCTHPAVLAAGWVLLAGPAAGVGLVFLLVGSRAGLGCAVPIGLACVPLAVVLLTTATVRVSVDADRLTVGLGPWAWPQQHMRLADIQDAWSEPQRPVSVRGWGLRGMPGRSCSLTLGASSCLAVRDRSGNRLAVTVDDAAQATALINTLTAAR